LRSGLGDERHDTTGLAAPTHVVGEKRRHLLARRLWLESQPGFDPDRLVFIDETGTTIKMTRLC
jgi:hypothetical protein